MTSIPTGRYRHYKGNLYDVVGTVRHSETEESLFYPLIALYSGKARLAGDASWPINLHRLVEHCRRAHP